MYRLRQTDVFARWLAGLRDKKAKARVLARLEACRFGNLGDTKAVGGGVRELRIHVGAGYRVYFARQSDSLLLLLLGGSKSTQSRDIERAQQLWAQLKDD